MYSKLDRKKNPPQIEYTPQIPGKSINLFEMLGDDPVKAALLITDEELDKLTDEVSDSELDMLLDEEKTFTQKRETLAILNRVL